MKMCLKVSNRHRNLIKTDLYNENSRGSRNTKVTDSFVRCPKHEENRNKGVDKIDLYTVVVCTKNGHCSPTLTRSLFIVVMVDG